MNDRDLPNRRMYWPDDWPFNGKTYFHDWPSALDIKRRQFLAWALKLAPGLKIQLLEVRGNARKLKKWRSTWHLPDPWCSRLLLDGGAPIDGGAPKPVPPPAEFDRLVAARRKRRTIRLGPEGTPVRLSDGVILSHALDTSEGPAWPPVGHHRSDAGDLRFPPRKLELEQFFFSPVNETPQQFIARVVASARAAAKALCESTIEDAKTLGLRSIRGKRGKGKARNDHFEWLARRQILGQGGAAASRPVDWPNGAPMGSRHRQKAYKAVKLLAAEIGLTLRKL